MTKTTDTERILNPKEEAFCQHYGDMQSATYGEGTRSAVRAGYAEKSAHTAAWKLLRRDRVKRRLQEIYEASEFTKEQIMSNLQADRQRALAKDDIASAIRADELMLKRHGLLSDRFLVQAELPARVEDLDEARVQTARRAALALHRTRLLPDGNLAPLPSTAHTKADSEDDCEVAPPRFSDRPPMPPKGPSTRRSPASLDFPTDFEIHDSDTPE